MPKIDRLLTATCKLGASDLHLRSGGRPRFRIDGRLTEHPEHPALTSDAISELLLELLSDGNHERFTNQEEVDFSYGLPGLGRFRCSCFVEYHGPAAAFRLVPDGIPTLRELHVPESLEYFAHLRNGLVLVTGPTGCGKSSTLAALIGIINGNFHKHIITLEDPIEFLHQSDKSIIHQRGMYHDFHDFESGLTSALEEGPDVLLVGELRETETIRLALNAAETGMLVFSTVHTLGAAQSIDRILDAFPANEQDGVRTLLSQSMEGVISQVLLKRVDQEGRIPATEVLVCGPAVRNNIREGKTQEIANSLLSGRKRGMHPLVSSLERLVEEGKISKDDALTYTWTRDRLKQKRQHK